MTRHPRIALDLGHGGSGYNDESEAANPACTLNSPPPANSLRSARELKRSLTKCHTALKIGTKYGRTRDLSHPTFSSCSDMPTVRSAYLTRKKTRSFANRIATKPRGCG